MSMICNLRQASDVKIEELLANPEEIVFFLCGPTPAPKPGFFARLFRREKEKAQNTREWSPPPDDEQVDLDKAWHGIHYLLTGSAWEGEKPLCYLVQGGAEVGDVDVGYGPARALRSDQVKAFHDALRALSREDLKVRYQPERMKELDIYPGIWDSEPPEGDPFGYLMEYVKILDEFLAKTVQKGLGLVVCIN
jgi:hypothetical protein